MDDLQMKRYKSLIAIGLTMAGSMLFGQEQHKEEFIVKDNVTLVLNTKHTHVQFETWNKNKVEIVGLVTEENISKQEKQALYDQWAFKATGNSSRIEVSSNTIGDWGKTYDVSGIKNGEAVQIIEPIIQEIVIPLVAELSEAPIPEAQVQSIGNLEFDYEAYQKDPKSYMKTWEKEVEKAYGKKTKAVVKIKEGKDGKIIEKQNFGFLDYPKSPFHPTTKKFDFDDNLYRKDKKNYLKKLNKIHNKEVTTKEVDVWLDSLKEWEQTVELKAEKLGEDIEVVMESFAESFEDAMEEWADEIEVWAENLAAQYDSSNSKHVKIVKMHKSTSEKSNKPSRTLVIKLPKNAKVILNARFGTIDMGHLNSPCKINTQYADVKAETVENTETTINASYGTVAIANWKQGELRLNYVESCKLKRVEVLNVNANSSDVHIDNLAKEAVVIGSFGELSIGSVASSFENLDIILENTDAKLLLPETDFSIYYNGNRSTFDYPSILDVSETTNGGTTIIKGYRGTKKNNKDIHISAKYSNIVLQ